MQHKVHQETVVTEPNLTPLLDLVLQILLFFITTTKMVEQEQLHKIDLPFSQTARPLDTRIERDYEFLTIDFDPRATDPDMMYPIRALGKPAFGAPNPETGRKISAQTELRTWLKRLYADRKRDARGGEVKTKIILRAHKDAEVGEVLKLFRLCQDVGFNRLSIRAFTKIKKK